MEAVGVLAPDHGLDLSRLKAGYRAGAFRPTDVGETVLDRIAQREDDKVWIHQIPRAASGHAIPVEVWEVPATELGSFVDGIPAPLGIGALELEDGEAVRGFLCEHYATAGARDISELGGWRESLVMRG